MDAQILFPVIAFFVTVIFQSLYTKLVVESDCPGKEPRSWLDHLVLSLPTSIAVTGIVYFFTSQWSPKRNRNNGTGNNVGRANNMGRMNGSAYGRNNGSTAALGLALGAGTAGAGSAPTM